MSAPVGSATLRALELPSLLAVIAQLAASDLGRRRILDLEPASEEEDLRARRGRYEEAGRLILEGRLVPSFEEPLAGVLDRLEEGRDVHGGHLLRWARALGATRDARGRILLAADPPCPALAALAEDLPDLDDLRRDIERALDRRGEVRDDASPQLVRLRGRIRGLRDGLYKDLRSYVEGHQDSLSEETIPLRGGRLVLTLKAGARGRVGGLTHGRSATGKSFYFEPFEVVESNNQLQQSSEDEQAERQRILADLVRRTAAALPALGRHAAFLAELDLLQASGDYARRVGGNLAELSGRGDLRLVDARHPLLDPALADLRQEALGQAGHQEPVVPLALEMSPRRRCLVVTGPNAGGKTVALKTLGLLALCHRCGLPVPAAAGSRIPLLSPLIATVGDEQDLLTDRSTFSARLLRLKEVWQEAGEDALVLLDELGSGTDPTEGAALAVTLLEALLERGSLALMTTHLVQLAAAALELEGAGCAAMELDAETFEPTFLLVPGPPGGSEALALARRLGLPAAWLDAAESRLGAGHRDLRRLLAEVEALRQELVEERLRLRRESEDAAKLRERLEAEEAEIKKERKGLSARLRKELEAFQQETARKLRDEVERLRGEVKKGRRKGIEGETVRRLFAEAPAFEAEPEAEPEGPPVVGGTVRHRGLGWEGVLEKLERGRAEVSVRGKKLRCGADELVGLERASAPPKAARPRVRAGQDPSADLGTEVASELNLIGQRVEPALDDLDAYLDRALLGHQPEVRVIHGHGSGRLRQAVREHLARHPAVACHRPGGPNEGGNGATVATLRGS